ncbi:MAG: hypothetical protein M9894_39465 [Planctomycetes bacterium]|nr:hypothetical protein [Planctomycetota bacterium]
MWRRLKRVVQSNLGRLSDLGGSGGRLTGDLTREARDLERSLKKTAEALATLKGEVTFLEDKACKLGHREEELVALEQAAVARGVEDKAGAYALELARVRAEQATVERQLAVAREALERGQVARAALQAQREQKLAEAREREKAYLELERDDARAHLFVDPEHAPAPAAPAPVPGPPGAVEALPPAARKTVGGPPPAEVPEAAVARSAKTIGPAPDAAPPPPEPPSPRPRLEIKVRVKDEPPPAQRPPADADGAPAPVAVVGEAPPVDIVGELERLARLRAEGVLSEEELEQAKRRLLGQGAGS